MRRRLYGLALLLVTSAGCATGPLARQPQIPTQKPTVEQLVRHLNSNSQAVQSIECSRVNIVAKQGIQTFGLPGMLAYQKPRNFRLVAEAAGTTQADFGSNDQEFWFWLKRAEPPGLRYCAYEDLPRLRNLPLPIHPDWIVEALCVTEFPSPDQYQLQTSNRDNTVSLVSQLTSPQGLPMQKIVVVALDTGRIKSHHLRSSQGREVWSAYIDEYQNAGIAVVPRKVRIHCPEEKLELQLKLDGCRVNNVVAGQTGERFLRPRGYQEIDLARGPVTAPQSIQRVRGQSR